MADENGLRMCVTLESVNELINRLMDICVEAASVNTPQGYSDGMDRIMDILDEEQTCVVREIARYKENEQMLKEFRERKKETIYKE